VTRKSSGFSKAPRASTRTGLADERAAVCFPPLDHRPARKGTNVNTMNVNSGQRSRRLPGRRTVPRRAQLAAAIGCGNRRGRAVARSRLGGRQKQASGPVPGRGHKKPTTFAGKRRRAIQVYVPDALVAGRERRVAVVSNRSLAGC